MTKIDLRLYGLIDPQIARGRSLAELTIAAVKGGATLIQYRDKNAETREMIERARSIKAALAGSMVPFLVNDRIDVALAAGADGIHIGQQDMHAQDARTILGPSAVVGLTVNNGEHAEEALRLPIDYACIGSVFPTGSKSNIEKPIGLNGLSALTDHIRRKHPYLPIGAIAGIDINNAASVIAAGSDGIAVISALFGSDDVTAAAMDLRATVDMALQHRD